MAVLSFDPGAFIGANAGEALDNWEVGREEQRWGIYLNGERCFTSAHLFSLNDEKRYQIASSPIEDGGFISTDKVDTPYTGTIQLACDGTDRGNFLTDMLPSFLSSTPDDIKQSFFTELQQRCGDLKQYLVRTPEGDVHRVNLTGWSRSKTTHQWANMVVVSVYLQEVRSATTSGWVQGVGAPQQVTQNSGMTTITPRPEQASWKTA